MNDIENQPLTSEMSPEELHKRASLCVMGALACFPVLIASGIAGIYLSVEKSGRGSRNFADFMALAGMAAAMSMYLSWKSVQLGSEAHQVENDRLNQPMQQIIEPPAVQNDEMAKAASFKKSVAIPLESETRPMTVSEIAKATGLTWQKAYEMGRAGYANQMFDSTIPKTNE